MTEENRAKFAELKTKLEGVLARLDLEESTISEEERTALKAQAESLEAEIAKITSQNGRNN